MNNTLSKDDIIKLAREAGLRRFGPLNIDCELERFANLVAAHKAEVALAEAYRCGYEAGAVAEREECAALAEKTICDKHIPTGVRIYGSRAAAAIRARGTT